MSMPGILEHTDPGCTGEWVVWSSYVGCVECRAIEDHTPAREAAAKLENLIGRMLRHLTQAGRWIIQEEERER